MLKEKAEEWNQDSEIQDLLVEINSDREKISPLLGAYSSERAANLKDRIFDLETLGARGLSYERLDQLTVELLLGVR
jgi:xylose isomerase